MVFIADNMEAKLAQPLPHASRGLGGTRVLLAPRRRGERGLQRVDEIGGGRKSAGRLLGVVAEVEIARQALAATARQGIVEDHRQSRIGTEAFAAHARR